MRERGLYRAKRPASGVEYAIVSFGNEGTHDVGRALYEARGYAPRFTMLPTKDEFERRKRTPLSARIIRDE